MFDIFDFLRGKMLTTRLLLLAAALGLLAVGIMTIYASGNPQGGSEAKWSTANFWQKQCVFAAAGFIAFLAVNSFDYKKIGEAGLWLYGIAVFFLLLLVLDKFIDIPFVDEKHGSRRWFELPLLPQFQPSEFFKFVYIIAISWHLRYRSNYRHISSLLPPFVLTIIPMFLILLEPDLGTVLLMMPVLLSMLFIAGAKIKHLLLIIALAVLSFPLLWFAMHDYQKMRISSVLLQNRPDGSNSFFRQKAVDNPKFAKLLGVHPQRLRDWDIGDGYQLARSKLAIASGGLAGQGYRKGVFIQYNFLPDRHNDFIFAIICHQWGFAGAVLLIALYAMLTVCCMEVSAASSDSFGKYAAAAVAVMFSIQTLANISMTIGIAPITGITLPLVSYGGSSIVVNFLSLGLVNNIARKS